MDPKIKIKTNRFCYKNSSWKLWNVTHFLPLKIPISISFPSRLFDIHNNESYLVILCKKKKKGRGWFRNFSECISVKQLWKNGWDFKQGSTVSFALFKNWDMDLRSVWLSCKRYTSAASAVRLFSLVLRDL